MTIHLGPCVSNSFPFSPVVIGFLVWVNSIQDRYPQQELTSYEPRKGTSQARGPQAPISEAVLPEKVDLNYSFQLPSSRFSSSNTATIHGQDFPVFTTDSNQSTWLPSSSPSLPAHSAQQQQLQHLNLPNNQQDFVLFDQPIKRQPNRSVSQPSANGRVNQTNLLQHRTQQLFPTSQLQQQQVTSPSVQHQRVSSIIQATGHNTTSSAFTNRFSSSAQNQHQFYASSAPSSTVALNLQNNRPVRPPVPLFTQSTGNIPQGKMNLQDLSDLEDFVAFEGGASTAYSSPAMPSVFDLSSSVTSNMGTVSPQDLLIQDPFMSAPNSTALTALTSPSIYNESPDFGDSFDVSPNFGSSDFDGGNDAWFPLFPPSNPQPELPKASPVEKSPAEKSDDLEVAERSPGHQRRKSGSSPPTGRHSSISGVNARHRNKPLPPIVVEDPNDTVAMKRARNTLAARKSRERKAQKFEELEEKIDKLTAERDYWRNMALTLGAKKE
ncbi:cross-pathway control protein 1 [Rhypophila decipiens]|uniref:Cross-pathway control protein 1 n=1 Tax=Rhypophila decipiens TaxID=261697 RepID=A0AAN6YID7_9PEZI|nr:cross-pathway control protein 1 [Rhypophila decipiens]